MSHLLPSIDSPLRECFAIEDLVAYGTGQRAKITLQEARFSARNYFRRRNDGSVNALYFIAMAMNDDLCLYRIGPRGGVKCLWNFCQ